MGKGTDKLYECPRPFQKHRHITHSEWSSEDAFGTSAGANARRTGGPGANFKRLPFNYCAASLQPFEHPVCTHDGTIFDLTNILPWVKKHGTNPVSGEPLKSSELVKLNFARNEDDEYVDPVTFKVFTNNTHIIALRNTGNVFSWDTIDRLNIKSKNWKDLVSEESFNRADIITLQDPLNVEARNLSSFKYLQDGENTLTPEQEEQRETGVNVQNLGSAAKILKAKEAVASRRAEREKAGDASSGKVSVKSQALENAQRAYADPAKSGRSPKPLPYNAARHTTGQTAASFTSTGLTPKTSGERAILTDEEYMLKPKRVKQKGYARLATSHGDINIELYPEHAPKAVWNFVQLAKKGYYRDVAFHRNIRNFMLQGGDPTGTGRGGQSIWGKPFADEFDGPLSHDGRGVISMANKGRDTNTSQFFITYRAVPHLNRKHTVFGRVVEGLEALSRLENIETDKESNRLLQKCTIEDIVIFIDPFEEYLKQRSQKEAVESERERVRREGGTEDDKTTWTGKRIRSDGKPEDMSNGNGIGKYLRTTAPSARNEENQILEENTEDWSEAQPSKKAKKSGGFGNFDSW